MTVTTTLMQNDILNYNFGGQAYALTISTFYFGLSTSIVGETGLASVTEPADAQYARVQITNDTDLWTTSTNGSLTTKVDVAFPASSESWGTILSIFIADAATNGNVLFYCTLAPSFGVQAYTTVTFEDGTIIFTM